MNQTINRMTSANRGILMTAGKSQAGAACRPPLPPANSLTQRLHLGILQSGESYWPKSGENLMASHNLKKKFSNEGYFELSEKIGQLKIDSLF